MIPKFIFRRRNFGGPVSKGGGVENVRVFHIEHICKISNHHALGSSKIRRIKFCLIVSSDFPPVLQRHPKGYRRLLHMYMYMLKPNQHFVVVCMQGGFFPPPPLFSLRKPGGLKRSSNQRGG